MSVKVLRELCQKHGLSVNMSRTLVQSMLDLVRDELEREGAFSLHGVGVIEIVPNGKRPPRAKNGQPNPDFLPVRTRFRVSPKLRIKIKESLSTYGSFGGLSFKRPGIQDEGAS